MSARFFPTRGDASARALSAREVSRALSELPGWKPFRYSRRLRGLWHFATAADAGGFVVAVEVIAFEHRVFPELHATGRTVTAVLTDPQAAAVTPTVLAFAKRLSVVAGPPGRLEPAQTPPLVAAVERELTSWLLDERGAGPAYVPQPVTGADPVAEMLALLGALESTLEAFVPRLQAARAALALLRTARADPETAEEQEAAGSPLPAERAAQGATSGRSPSLSDSTEDLTPYLRPKPGQDGSEP